MANATQASADTPLAYFAEGDARRQRILDAAFECFVKSGYSKVAINHIALEAGLARPLIYLKFKSKEDIFLNLFEGIFDSQLERVEALVDQDVPARDKLLEIFNIMILELWPKLSGSPQGNDLLDATYQIFPKVNKRYRARLATIMSNILGDTTECAEVLILAVKGLYFDRPPVALLRHRIALLVDRFV